MELLWNPPNPQTTEQSQKPRDHPGPPMASHGLPWPVAEALLRLVLHEERRAEGVAVVAMAVGEALADFSGDWVWRRWAERCGCHLHNWEKN